MSQSILSSFSQAFEVFPERFHRRRGVLGPRFVMMILVAMSDPGNRSYSRGLRVVRDLLEPLGGRWAQLAAWMAPTKEAFAQARRKLRPEQCVQGFHDIRASIHGARDLKAGLLRGLRRVAIDGTRLCLPDSPDIAEVFGYHGSGEHRSAVPMAGLVLLWDISANQPMAWELNDARLKERAASFTLIDHLGPEDVLIADRGYPSFEFFKALRSQGTNFIVRMNTTTISVAQEVRDFLDSAEDDAIVECPPVRNDFRRFDGSEPLRLRLVRDRRHGDRVIATNLTDPSWTAAELLEAYRSRWKIETAIREGKDWRGLEDFRARYADGIRQEIAAIMTFLYLVGEMECEMHKIVRDRIEEGKEPEDALENMPYTFNRCLMGSIAVDMLIAAMAGKDLSGRWAQDRHQLWRERNRKRPNRSNPRQSKTPHSKWRRTGPYGTRA